MAKKTKSLLQQAKEESKSVWSPTEANIIDKTLVEEDSSSEEVDKSPVRILS
jgi:hypothetical protein